MGICPFDIHTNMSIPKITLFSLCPQIYHNLIDNKANHKNSLLLDTFQDAEYLNIMKVPQKWWQLGCSIRTEEGFYHKKIHGFVFILLLCKVNV